MSEWAESSRVGMPASRRQLSGPVGESRMSPPVTQPKASAMPHESLTEPLYSIAATAQGGRAGHVSSEDGVVHLKLGKPGSKANPKANPETLFAAGYAACFGNALNSVADRDGPGHLRLHRHRDRDAREDRHGRRSRSGAGRRRARRSTAAPPSSWSTRRTSAAPTPRRPAATSTSPSPWPERCHGPEPVGRWPAASDQLVEQAGVDVVHEPADRDLVADEGVRPDRAHVGQQGLALVVDDVEALPRRVLTG